MFADRRISQSGCFKKTKHVEFSEKHFLPHDTYTYVCVSRGKKLLFFRKIDVLCFPETPVYVSFSNWENAITGTSKFSEKQRKKSYFYFKIKKKKKKKSSKKRYLITDYLMNILNMQLCVVQSKMLGPVNQNKKTTKWTAVWKSALLPNIRHFYCLYSIYLRY